MNGEHSPPTAKRSPVALSATFGMKLCQYAQMQPKVRTNVSIILQLSGRLTVDESIYQLNGKPVACGQPFGIWRPLPLGAVLETDPNVDVTASKTVMPFEYGFGSGCAGGGVARQLALMWVFGPKFGLRSVEGWVIAPAPSPLS